MIQEDMFLSGLESKQYKLEHSLSSKNRNRFVDLDMVAHFFYDQVRAQEYTVRHQLADRFRGGQKMLGSGWSSFFSEKSKKLTEEGIACLLFSFYMTFLKEQKYQYRSGTMGYLFATGGEWGSRPFYVKRGEEYQFDRDDYGDGCLRLECSSLTFGFLSLLWAFGFDKEQLYSSCISHDNIVVNKPFGAVNRAHLGGIGGSDIQAVQGVDTVCSPEYEFMDTLPGIRKLVQEVGDGMPTTEQAKRFRNIVDENLSNAFYLDPRRNIRMLKRDLFSNHYCAKVVGKKPFLFPYFDPLTALRYKNGLTDLFEEYRLSNTIFSGMMPDGKTRVEIKQYEHDAVIKLSKRRIYNIPDVLDPYFKKSQFEYCGLKHARFDYTDPDTNIVYTGKTMYEIARIKKVELYILLDEHDWADEDPTAKLPRRIVEMINVTRLSTQSELPEGTESKDDFQIQPPKPKPTTLSTPKSGLLFSSRQKPTNPLLGVTSQRSREESLLTGIGHQQRRPRPSQLNLGPIDMHAVLRERYQELIDNNGFLTAGILKYLIGNKIVDLGIQDDVLAVNETESRGSSTAKIFTVSDNHVLKYVIKSPGSVFKYSDGKMVVIVNNLNADNYIRERTGGGYWKIVEAETECRALERVMREAKLKDMETPVFCPEGVLIKLAVPKKIFSYKVAAQVGFPDGKDFMRGFEFTDKATIEHQIAILNAAQGISLGKIIDERSLEEIKRVVKKVGIALGAFHQRVKFSDAKLRTGGFRTVVHGDFYPSNIYYQEPNLLSLIDLAPMGKNFEKEPHGHDMLLDIRRFTTYQVNHPEIHEVFLEGYIQNFNNDHDLRNKEYVKEKMAALPGAPLG